MFESALVDKRLINIKYTYQLAEALEKSMTSVAVIKTETDNYTLPL